MPLFYPEAIHDGFSPEAHHVRLLWDMAGCCPLTESLVHPNVLMSILHI